MPRNPETFGQGARSHQKCPRPCLAPGCGRKIMGKPMGKRSFESLDVFLNWHPFNHFLEFLRSKWISTFEDYNTFQKNKILWGLVSTCPGFIAQLRPNRSFLWPSKSFRTDMLTASVILRFFLWENPQITIKTMVKSTSNYHVWITIYQWNQEPMK